MEEALDIPKVLEMILGNLDKHSLLECRKVCKKWNAEAIKILENQIVAKPHLPSSQTHFNRYCAGNIDGVSIKFKKFHFDISIDCVPNQYATSVEGLQKYLNCLKYQIKSLSLWIRTPVSMPAQQLLHIIFSLPQLESLDVDIQVKALKGWRNQIPSNQELNSTFSGCTLPQLKSIGIYLQHQNLIPVGYRGVIEFFIKSLVACAINVKSFTLSNYGEYTGGSLKQIISSISSPSLQEVLIAGEWPSPDNVNCLYNHVIPFPLTTIDLCIDMSKIGAAEIKKLLSTYSITLETLNLWFENEHCFYEAYLPFPLGVCMTKLHNLKLEIQKPVLLDWSHLPQLKRLQFKRSSFELLKSSVMAHSDPVPLESLELAWPMEPAKELLKMWAEVKVLLFSRLTSVKLCLSYGITPQLLQFIFKECRELQEFNTFLTDEINDYIFCGVAESKNLQLAVTWPDENIRNEDRNKEETISRGFRGLVEQAQNSDLGLWRALPWIGDLKHLRSLTLFRANMLSELSLLHGILQCGALGKLEIESNNMNVQRVTRIIQQSNLVNLTSVKFNYKYLNHLS